MKNRTALWGVVVVIAVIALLLLTSKPTPPPKARAQRITSVNTVRTVSLILTNTNTLPAPQTTPARN